MQTLIRIVARRPVLLNHIRAGKGDEICRIKASHAVALPLLKQMFGRANTYYAIEAKEVDDPRPLPDDVQAAQAEIKALREQLAEAETTIDKFQRALEAAAPKDDEEPQGDAAQEGSEDDLESLPETATEGPAENDLRTIKGIGAKTAEALMAMGITSTQQLWAALNDEAVRPALIALHGVSENDLADWLDQLTASSNDQQAAE